MEKWSFEVLSPPSILILDSRRLAPRRWPLLPRLPARIYLGGAFDVESVVENLLRRLAANQELVVDVYDVKNHSNPLVVYGSEVPLGAPSPPQTCMLHFGDPFRRHHMICMCRNKPHVPWSAITTPSFVYVICMLVGYIIYAAWIRYVSVKEDCRNLEELKKRASSTTS